MDTADATTTPQTPVASQVVVYFTNGTSQQFDEVTDYKEIPTPDPNQTGIICFVSKGKRFVFRKQMLAGWAESLTVPDRR